MSPGYSQNITKVDIVLEIKRILQIKEYNFFFTLQTFSNKMYNYCSYTYNIYEGSLTLKSISKHL